METNKQTRENSFSISSRVGWKDCEVIISKLTYIVMPGLRCLGWGRVICRLGDRHRKVGVDARLHASSFGVRFAAHAFRIEGARLRLRLVGMLGA